MIKICFLYNFVSQPLLSGKQFAENLLAQCGTRERMIAVAAAAERYSYKDSHSHRARDRDGDTN